LAKRESGSDLGDFGVRKYEAETGRFLSVDPLWEEQRPWNVYHYSANNPIVAKDPDGKLFDVIVDIAFIAYDVYDIGKTVVKGERVSGTQVAALGADIIGAVVPGLTGGGAAVRAAAHADDAVKVIKGADKAADAAKAGGKEATSRAKNVAAADAKGIPVSQLGPSGKPKIHNVEKPNLKRAEDAARNYKKSNSKPEKHNSDRGQKQHFHPTRNGEKLTGKDNIHFVNKSSKKNPK